MGDERANDECGHPAKFKPAREETGFGDAIAVEISAPAAAQRGGSSVIHGGVGLSSEDGLQSVGASLPTDGDTGTDDHARAKARKRGRKPQLCLAAPMAPSSRSPAVVSAPGPTGLGHANSWRSLRGKCSNSHWAYSTYWVGTPTAITRMACSSAVGDGHTHGEW